MDIKALIEQSITVKQALLADEYVDVIASMSDTLIAALRTNKKILIAGNGGSAADAQHFAAELTGRFVVERAGLPVIALTTNASIITAVANDFAFDKIFSRQVEAYGAPGDVFVGITTSGNSKNILEAIEVSKQHGMISVGLLGRDGGQAQSLCDIALTVPSQSTQCIQEAHAMILHLMSAIVDDAHKGYSPLEAAFSSVREAVA